MKVNLLLPLIIITSSLYMTPSVCDDSGFELLFRDNLDELVDVTLNFTQKIPSSIKGTLIRNGMGRWRIGDRQIRHVMDGYAKLTKITFVGDGMTAKFSTRFLTTDSYQRSVRQHAIQPCLFLFGLDPPLDFFERLEAFWCGVDNLNVNVVRLSDDGALVIGGTPARHNVSALVIGGTPAHHNVLKFNRKSAADNVGAPGLEGRAWGGGPRWSTLRWRGAPGLEGDVARRKLKTRATAMSRMSPGRFVTTSDATRMYEFDPRALVTLRRVDFGVPNASAIVNLLSMMSSAHPVQEMDTNHHIDFVTTIHPLRSVATISLMRIKSIDDRETIARWHADYIPYMHSFALSEHYAIVFQCPLYVSLRKLAETAEAITSLYWQNSTMTDIVVVDVKSGAVRRFALATGFTMHFANAYEEESAIIIDAVVYPNIDFLESLQVSTLSNQTARDRIPVDCHLTRFIIDLKTQTVLSKLLTSVAGKEFVSRLDMPIINERFRFRRYRYIYGVSLKIFNSSLTDLALVKKDLMGTDDKFWYEDSQYVTEPTFVESSDAKSEDDGHLVAVVLDGKRGQSYILVIDAITMTTVSKAPLPTLVPFSIHGKFFDDVY